MTLPGQWQQRCTLQQLVGVDNRRDGGMIFFFSPRQRNAAAAQSALRQRPLSPAGMNPLSTQDGTRDQPLREAFQTFRLVARREHRCYKSAVFFELPKIVRDTYFQTNKISVSAIVPLLVALSSTRCWKGFLVSRHGTPSLRQEMLSEEVLHVTASLGANVTVFPFALKWK